MVELLTATVSDDADASVREVAAWALGEAGGRCGRRGGARPRGVWPDTTTPLCREAAVAALGAVGDPVGLDTVLAGAG